VSKKENGKNETGEPREKLKIKKREGNVERK